MWRVYKHTGKDKDYEVYKEATNEMGGTILSTTVKEKDLGVTMNALQTKLERLSEILSTN